MQKSGAVDNINRSIKPFIIEKRDVKRTSSCPPGRVRSTTTGSWSLDWVKKHKRIDVGGPVLSCTKVTANCSSKNAPRFTRKKGNGSLHHCARSLKCIARLSDKERKELLRVLQRSMKKRNMLPDESKPKGNSTDVSASNESQSSVNND